jgi:tetratricopeptide (TPR) repeat protein
MAEYDRKHSRNCRRKLSKHRLLSLSVLLWLGVFSYGTVAGAKNLSKTESELWNSPKFQKRFAESYLAETEIEPTITEREREKMLKVLELISADKMDEAAAMLQKETKEASSAVFDFTLANIYFQQEQLEKAAVNYEKAVEKYPKFRRAWKNLGLIHIRNGAFKKAIRVLTRVIELGGSDALSFAQLGYAYLMVENDLCAESAYRMAVLLDPETLDWKIGLATSILKQERYAEAVSLFDGLITDDPDRSDLWLYQANAYIGLNKPLEAAINYELVDRLGESTAGSLNKLGDIYLNQELFETAVNSYIRALEKDPKGGIKHIIRVAKILIFHNALTETKRLIDHLESLQGTNLDEEDRKDLLKVRAQIAVAEGSGEEQVKVLEEIVELDPLDGQALILLGQQYVRAGDFEKAVFYYERAEGLEKFEAEAKVRHAQVLVRQGKYAEALPLLRRAQDIKPRDDVRKYMEQVERFAKSR